MIKMEKGKNIHVFLLPFLCICCSVSSVSNYLLGTYSSVRRSSGLLGGIGQRLCLSSGGLVQSGSN